MTEKSSVIDINHINHFIIYYIFGLYFPKHYIFVFVISILWELFEYIIVTNNTLYHLTKKYWFIPEKYWNEKIQNSIIDICVNMLGYYLSSNSIPF
jgi:hypothetical protein